MPKYAPGKHTQSFTGCSAAQWTVYQPVPSDPITSQHQAPDPHSFVPLLKSHSLSPFSYGALVLLSPAALPQLGRVADPRQSWALQDAPSAFGPSHPLVSQFKHSEIMGQAPSKTSRQLLSGLHHAVTGLPSQNSGFLKGTHIAYKKSPYPSTSVACCWFWVLKHPKQGTEGLPQSREVHFLIRKGKKGWWVSWEHFQAFLQEERALKRNLHPRAGTRNPSCGKRGWATCRSLFC